MNKLHEEFPILETMEDLKSKGVSYFSKVLYIIAKYVSMKWVSGW